MGLYSKSIKKKEEFNNKLELYADESIINDKAMVHIENEMDEVQSAVIYILGKFGIHVTRQFGHLTIHDMLDSMLDPLGMMFDYSESVEMYVGKKTEYVLAFRKDGKAVALTPSVNGYRWYCPSEGTSGMATNKYCMNLKKGCYVFNRPLKERKTIIGTFISNVVSYLTLYDLVRLAMATLVIVLLGYIMPKINQWVYNVYIPGKGKMFGAFQLALMLFITISIIRAVLTTVKSLILSKVKIRVSMKMQSAVMAKVLHLPQSFFRENSSGKLSKRINSCSRLSDMILSVFMDVVLDLAFSVIYLFQMESIASQLFLPAIIFLGIKIIVSVIGSICYMINESRTIEVDMENTNLLYSSIRGIQKIKGMGAEKAVYSKWAELYRKTLQYNYKQPFFLKYQNVLITAVSSCATITLLGVTAWSNLSRESYMTFISSYALVITVVQSLTDMMNNIFLMSTLSKNVEPIFVAANEQSKVLEYVRKISGDIRVDNVFFKYPESSKGCLDGVTIDIHRGEKIAIVGESGCGKSTLLKLLIGFEKPDAGMIYYDNKPLDTLNLKSLRRSIGSVFQFSKVFPGTIRSNVTFTAQGEVSDEKIWDAVDKAAIGDYIRSLPLQLDTEISESNSCGFSGGQRQRILLARAFVSNPKVLILDEATSALDNITQNQVLESINKINTTVIMVAHRLSTVEGFDKIIMLDKGRIVEQGSYEELMAKNDRFAELVRKQLVKTS